MRLIAAIQHLTWAVFDDINAHLGKQGLFMRAGTIIDASIIATPDSTKKDILWRFA